MTNQTPFFLTYIQLSCRFSRDEEAEKLSSVNDSILKKPLPSCSTEEVEVTIRG